MGKWTALTGESEATNIESGEESTAFKAFPTADITNFFLTALKLAHGTTVEFAVKVGLRLPIRPLVMSTRLVL